MCGGGVGSGGDLANCASDHVGKGHPAPAAPFVRLYQYLAEARSYNISPVDII